MDIRMMVDYLARKKRREWPHRCDYCGMETVKTRVHGHEQCACCGVNVEPCCEGARYETLNDWKKTQL